MASTTGISWTDASWNPVHGCSKVSPGCAHCYAETLSRRYKQTPAPWTPANATENVILKPHKLREPLKWKEPRMVFVNSMSDLFHELVPFDYIDRVFTVMVEADRHTFQVLTKRPDRMLAYFVHAAEYMGLQLADLRPWPNVWLGVSIENRRFVHRADVLRQTPAAVRFISAEPLLGPLMAGDEGLRTDGGEPWGYNTVWPDGYIGPELDLTGIDWIIVGGESGPGNRRLDLQWARDLRDSTRCDYCSGTGADGDGEGALYDCRRCDGTGRHTACFVKQLGGARPGTKLEDLPLDLRIREFPAVAEKPAAGTLF